MTTKFYDITNTYLRDTIADPLFYRPIEAGALESHLTALRERLQALERRRAPAQQLADIKLQISRAVVTLGRGEEAWALAREAFDVFIATEEFEPAADACDVLFQCNQPLSLAALGQGIWLAVTYPIDVELAVELITHVVDETPDESDGAAVAATTAHFLADLRAEGKTRENLMFFTSQLLGKVARQHSGVLTQQAFDDWMQRLELREPYKFLVRLRNIIDVLVQDQWWFDRDLLLARLPAEAGRVVDPIRPSGASGDG